MKNTHQDRLTRYVVMAAVPAAASAGYAVADFIHYGGPAIEVTRTLLTSGTYDGRFVSISAGSRSALYGSDNPKAPMQAANFRAHKNNTKSASFGSSKNKQRAKFGVFNNSEKASFAVATDGNGKAKRFSASNSVSDSKYAKFNDGTMLLAKTLNSSSSYDSSSWSTSYSKGAWALNGEDEQRGYLGFGAEIYGDLGFGWMDIGWDGTTLTIYDWAFNTDGAIHVADTGVVPGGTGIAALAMGAAGLRRRRKRSA